MILKKTIKMKTTFKTLMLPGLFLIVNNLKAQTAVAVSTDTFEMSNNTLFYLLCALAAVMILVVIVLSSAIKHLAGNSQLWKNRWNVLPVLAGLLLFFPTDLNAQSSAGNANAIFSASDGLISVMWSIIAFLSLIILFMAQMLKKMLNALKPEQEEQLVEEPSLITVIQAKLTDLKPLEQENDILLDHDYDGIKELDNNLPPWWKYGFYVTIVFALIYMFRFHVTGDGDLQDVEYQKEMAEAELQKAAFMKLAANNVDESSVTYLADAASLNLGKSIYIQNCAACHGASGEGGVGPNFTDDFWIHGGDVKDVFKLIKYGVPQKGMIAWQSQLNPRQMQEVASFILSLQGTNPPNAKEPQGEKYVPVMETEAEVNPEVEL
jgi:cytochrome c oxidase cbb3-type subunit III